MYAESNSDEDDADELVKIDDSDATPTAWAFLLLALALNLALGSLSSYSFWKTGFYRYFSACSTASAPNVTTSASVNCWNDNSLTEIFNAGVFGGYLCVIPGLMFDFLGVYITSIYGIGLVNIGFGGILLFMHNGHGSNARLVAFLYFLEEQGAAATLYMIPVCVLVRCFPVHLVGVVSGAVGVAFGLSGWLWKEVGRQVFGFSQKTDAESNLFGLFLTLLLTINALSISLLISAPLALGDSNKDRVNTNAASGSSSTNGSLGTAILSLNFIFLILVPSIGGALVLGMNVYISSVQSAFVSLNTGLLGHIPFMASVGGRVIFGLLANCAVRSGGTLGVTVGCLCIHLFMLLCFAMLTLAAMNPGTASWAVYPGLVLGFSGFGGSVCFFSSFIKLNFHESVVGVMIGCLFTFAAIANCVFLFFFGPQNSLQNPGVERTPPDFIRPWTVGVAYLLAVLPVTLCVVIRAAKHGCFRELEEDDDDDDGISEEDE